MKTIQVQLAEQGLTPHSHDCTASRQSVPAALGDATMWSCSYVQPDSGRFVRTCVVVGSKVPGGRRHGSRNRNRLQGQRRYVLQRQDLGRKLSPRRARPGASGPRRETFRAVAEGALVRFTRGRYASHSAATNARTRRCARPQSRGTPVVVDLRPCSRTGCGRPDSAPPTELSPAVADGGRPEHLDGKRAERPGCGGQDADRRLTPWPRARA
jgi:hypothetical protein